MFGQNAQLPFYSVDDQAAIPQTDSWSFSVSEDTMRPTDSTPGFWTVTLHEESLEIDGLLQGISGYFNVSTSCVGTNESNPL